MIRTLGRFRPEFLFRPRSIAVLGAGTEAGQIVLRNLRDASFPGALHALEAPADLQALNGVPDLGVIAGELQPSLNALAAKGTEVAIALSPGPWRPTSCRLLGPNAFGVIVPAQGLNASLGHLPPRPGKLALVSPSAALCRTVLDWAEPNGVGFSTIVGPGAEADLNAADILDFLSREPATGAILLDIRTIRDRRASTSLSV